jgi:hypothetical protein
MDIDHFRWLTRLFGGGEEEMQQCASSRRPEHIRVEPFGLDFFLHQVVCVTCMRASLVRAGMDVTCCTVRLEAKSTASCSLYAKAIMTLTPGLIPEYC